MLRNRRSAKLASMRWAWAARIPSLAAQVLPWGIVLVLLFWNLQWYPRTWFDEGEFLQVPKNLVLYGRYAMKSAEGFRDFDPNLTTGPAVLLPIAAALWAFGIGLLQARIVIVVYAVASLVLLYRCARVLVARRTAYMALALVVAAPWSEFLILGRQVLGEVPAFAWLVLGLLLWWRSIDHECAWWSFGSGIALTLAVLAKPQAALIWLSLLLVALADRLYYRKLRTMHWLLPLAVSASACLVWYVVVNPLGLTGSATGSTLLLVSPRRMVANLNLLGRSGFLVWGIPALAYQGLLTTSMRRSGLKEFFLLSVVVIWLAWYVCGSVGWTRYAFLPLALTCVFIARLFADATNGFSVSWSTVRGDLNQGRLGPASTRLTLMLLPLLLVLYGTVSKLDMIATDGDRTPQAFAEYLENNVGKGYVMETWEWEIAFLTDHSYHHPPFEVLDAMIGHVQFGRPLPENLYELERIRPEYLIDGPFSKWTGLYSQYISAHCIPSASVGQYDLYACQR